MKRLPWCSLFFAWKLTGIAVTLLLPPLIRRWGEMKIGVSTLVPTVAEIRNMMLKTACRVIAVAEPSGQHGRPRHDDLF
jgi:hypothetical protein